MNDVPVYNVCSECGRKIKIRKPRDQLLASSLEKSKIAVCRKCDPTSFWTSVLPKDYFLNLLNLAPRAFPFRIRAPAGTPSFWEGKARREYVCSECGKAIGKGEMYIGVKKLSGGYPGRWGRRGYYKSARAHVRCLLAEEEARIQKEIENATSAIERAESDIVNFRQNISLKQKQIETHQAELERVRGQYASELQTRIKEARSEIEKAKEKKRPKWHEVITIIPAVAKAIRYTDIMKARNNEIEWLEKEVRDIMAGQLKFTKTSFGTRFDRWTDYRHALLSERKAISRLRTEIAVIEGKDMPARKTRINELKGELDKLTKRLREIRIGIEELKTL